MKPSGLHFTANGVRLHYLDYTGNGEPLLILPGITSPAITWDFVSRRLAENFHVLTLDIRGRGLSESRPGLSYRLRDYAEDAQGMIEALKLGTPNVLGHSMGARIGVRLAATAPQLVSKLLLIDPPCTGPGRRHYPTPLQWYLDSRREVAEGAGVEAMRTQLPGWTDEQLATRVEWLPTCTEEAIVQSYQSFHEENMHADLPKVHCPSILIYAGKGGTVTDEDAKEISSLMPDCQVMKIENAGHMIPWDDLNGFIATVRGFLIPR